MKTEMHVSTFARASYRDGLVAVFHQLRPVVTYLSAARWEQYLTSPESDVGLDARLIETGILVQHQDDGGALTRYRDDTKHRLSRPTILYLMLAQGCNNVCVGCPVPVLAAKHGNKLLTRENALAGVKFWQRQLADWDDGGSFHLLFYGGEPLLNRSVLEASIAYVADQRLNGHLPAKTEMSVPTNGRLIDASLANLFARNRVSVVVGMDGPPDLNDAVRVTTEGLGTSAEIERSVRILLENKVSTGASVTLTPSNVREATRIREYIRSLGIYDFGFNVLKGSALAVQLGEMTEKEYFHLVAEAVLSGYDENANVQNEYQLRKRLDALDQHLPFALDCTCFGNQLVVQPDGMVSNCPFDRVDAGSIQTLPKDFTIADSQVVAEWRTSIPLLTSSQPTTANTFIHAGSCGFGSRSVSPGTDVALFNEEVMHGLIWKRLPPGATEGLQSGRDSYWSDRRLGAL